MYCESCMLNGKSSIFPSGSFDPDYYILGDATTQNEIEANQVLSITTPAGQYLNNVCHSIGMTQDNTRFFKVVRCAPDYYNNSEDLPARDNCHHFAFMDIYKTRPKIIVTLGREVSRLLLGDRATAISSIRGRIYDVVIQDQTFKVMPTFSPNFIVNNPNQSEQFVNDLMHAMSYVKGDLVDIEQKELLYATNYEEFHKYYEEKLKDKQIVSFDLETNARDARSQDARMVGFSMAPDGTSGIYVVRESLEYQMPNEDWEKITELAKSILNEKTALIHNTMYEVPFTYNEWGVYIDNFIDTLIKARLLLGGKIGAGLKDRCILDLGYPDWDHDLDEYKSGFTTLISKLRPTSSGSIRWDFTHMKNRGLASLYDEYANEIEQGRELDKRCAECYNALNKIRNVILKYYTTDTDYSIIIELIGDEIAALIDAGYSGPFSYGFIPMRIITKYGAMDSVGTQDLNAYLDKKIKEFSDTLHIDLNNGYEYMRRHYVSGTWMEMNGLYWNEDVANTEKKWYEDQCLKSSLAMIDSSYLDDMLFKEQKWILNDYIVENHLDMVRQILGDFYIMKSGIKLVSTGELIRYKNILERLGPSFADQYRSVLLSLVRQKARTHTHYKELKYIFNPASPKQSMKDTLNSVFITPEIQIAHFMNKLNVMLDDGDFSLEKYPPSDRPLFRVLLDCRKYNKYVDEYNQKLEDSEEDLEIIDRLSSMEEQLNISDDDQSDENSSASKKVKLTSADTFRRFASTLAETRIQSRELVMSASESMNYRLDSISEPNIIELNTYYCITGVDVDDQSTWTERYKFLVNFRMWKKCNKMITTYIDGSKVGRGSVWMVDKKGLQSGELLTRRKRLYDGNVHEDECCLMQPAYKVCLAGDTKVKCLDGKSYSMKELTDNGVKSLWVYAKSDNGAVVPVLANNLGVTRRNAELVEVTLDNGDIIKCTPDHEFLLRDGSYLQAKSLEPGTSLMPLYFRTTDRGYLQYYDELTSSYKNVHTLVNSIINHQKYEELIGSSDYLNDTKFWRVPVTHHAGVMNRSNKLDNRPENLVWMTRRQHNNLHSNLGFKAYNSTHKAELSERAKHNKLVTEYNGSEAQRQQSRLNGQKSGRITGRITAPKNFAAYRGSEAQRQKLREIAKRPDRMEHFMKVSSNYLASEKHREDARRNYGKGLGSEEVRESNAIRLAESNKDSELNKLRSMRKIGKIVQSILNEGLELSEETYSKQVKTGYPSYKYLINYFGSIDSAKEYAVNFNHQVVSVRLLDYTEDVYDLEVPQYHNFLLDAGVFVHNCTANSYRWQAGMHTIPAESSIKNIYTSRYEGGCIAAPDFSQMELRTMAGASKCTAMIEAFRSGADIHLQNAVKIFKKPAEEITAAERRYSKMASFMILYGGDYRNFGEEFLDGDIKLAKYIYDSFYESYPEVAQYIEDKHKEMKEHGKVTTLMDMFLNISPDDDVCRGDEGKALRIAQNAPIQSAASMIAGCCLYEIMKFIREHNFKSKVILFVHDSIEVDIHPAEMLQLASQIVPMMNKFPNEQFNMPVKADLVLGKSIGQEVTIEEIHCNEDFTEGEMICEADEDNFDALINEWKKVYKSVTWEDIDEPKVKYKSWSGLWISKLAVQRSGYGINYKVVHRKVKVII